MQYIVVPQTLCALDIVLQLILSCSIIQYFANRYKNAHFFMVFANREPEKLPLGQGMD